MVGCWCGVGRLPFIEQFPGLGRGPRVPFVRVGIRGGLAEVLDGTGDWVAEVEGDAFAVWLIPTTLEVTNVRARGVGQSVNLEFDLLGKYVEKLLNIRSP